MRGSKIYLYDEDARAILVTEMDEEEHKMVCELREKKDMSTSEIFHRALKKLYEKEMGAKDDC